MGDSYPPSHPVRCALSSSNAVLSWTYTQLTKMIRRIAVVFEYLPPHIGAGKTTNAIGLEHALTAIHCPGDEPDLGRDFTKKLGNSYTRLIAASGHVRVQFGGYWLLLRLSLGLPIAAAGHAYVYDSGHPLGTAPAPTSRA